jgi:hypothetical protein
MSTLCTWPSPAELAGFIDSLGLDAKVAGGDAMRLNMAMAIEASVEKWESVTGYRPFLSTQATLSLDPPGPDKGPVGVYAGLIAEGGGRKLFLPSGLWQITDSEGNPATTITVGVTDLNPEGQVVTLGTDFWLRPNNAPFFGKPYSGIEFRVPQYGEPQSILIPGLWGRVKTLPPDVRLAILQNAAASIAPNLGLNISEGLYEWKRGDEMERYGGPGDSSPLSGEAKQWAAMFQAAATRYQRVSIT